MAWGLLVGGEVLVHVRPLTLELDLVQGGAAVARPWSRDRCRLGVRLRHRATSSLDGCKVGAQGKRQADNRAAAFGLSLSPMIMSLSFRTCVPLIAEILGVSAFFV